MDWNLTRTLSVLLPPQSLLLALWAGVEPPSLSFSECAKMLDLSPSTAKQEIQKARYLLRMLCNEI